MDFDLWTLLVEQLAGSFWIAVLMVTFLLFLILMVFGRMSGITTQQYIMLFLMTMTLGFGVKWVTILISLAIISWAFIKYREATSA